MADSKCRGGKMKVSLIIPVYNVEKFLVKCLDSVEKQTYKDLEVIIVNDGSTDGCLKIIEDYVGRNPHFCCYSIENRGLGGARNYGISKAEGDYIFFLDSDDYISPDCIEKLTDRAKKDGSDIVICNNYDVREDGRIILAYKNIYRKNPTTIYDEHELLFNRVSAWGKLYKKELFDGLEFISREWYEDMRLIPKIYLRARKISYVDESLVYYVQRKGSIMNNPNLEKNLAIADTFDDLISYYKAEGVYPIFKNELEFLVVEHIAIAGLGRVARGGKRGRPVLSRMEEYLHTFTDLYDNPYMNSLARNRRIVLYCNRRKWYGLTRIFLNIKSLMK